ncbi:hypothetical protein WG904_03995 [Pedobacter sp. Du54]|uniref:hypothetical protein n=1 Tax=Pedobacter anseongensis TaxID=3133439 RepID=UPI003097640D
MNALLNSENETHLKSWLSIIKMGELSKDYYIAIDQNKAIKSDRYFNDICEIINTSRIEMHAYTLMRYFDKRKDKATTDFLNKCLSHPFERVKERARQLLND